METDSVSLHYLVKILREYRESGMASSAKIVNDLITDPDTRFSDERVYWPRENE